jgi:hypothetical protein
VSPLGQPHDRCLFVVERRSECREVYDHKPDGREKEAHSTTAVVGSHFNAQKFWGVIRRGWRSEAVAIVPVVGEHSAEQLLAQARAVEEDLAYLQDEWEPELHAPTLRRLSPTIRRLLVYGDYEKAWRTVGLPGQPSITATDLDAMLGSVDRSVVELAFAPPAPTVAGLMTEGGDLHVVTPASVGPSLLILIPGLDAGLGTIFAAVPYSKLSYITADPSEEARREFRERLGQRVERSLTVSEYLRSPAAWVNGVLVTRQDVIGYVTNKRGGAHFDPKRDRKNDARLALLDKTLARYAPTGAPEAPYAFAELLSIAEFLAASPDATRFRQQFAAVEAAA